MIRALPAIRAVVPNVRLEIAGDGPERSALERECRLLGVMGSVDFLGWQPDIQPWLSRWDVVIQPSLSEGFGLAALEAMAASTPVVATAVGGAPEVVDDGVTGWLVPPGDPAALGERIQELLLNPDLRTRMGTAGRRRAESQFSVHRMVAETGRIYAQLLGRS